MTKLMFAVGLSFGAAFGQSSEREAATPPPPIPAFQQPELFIDKCPQNDPAFSTIRADFAILRDGVVETATPPCTEPFTTMPAAGYSEELELLQALRMAYYLDQGRSNYLPWTPLRLYDWIKSKVAGFNILTTATSSSCCFLQGGKSYIFYAGVHDDSARQGQLTLRAVIANMALISHESRHVDGYPHNSCCGINNGCDTSYDETNLTAYGIQYYLQRLVLTGDLNLNLGCLDLAQLGPQGAFQLGDASVFANRFCTVKPPALPATTSIGAACTPGPYPYISPGGIANAASFKTDAIAPGSLISIFGPNLAASSEAATATPLPAKLANVKVDIGGRVTPLWSVNAPPPGGLSQINVQVPYEIPLGAAVMRVTSNGNVGFRRQFKETMAGPGIFAYGNNRAVLFNQDSMVNSPDTPAPAGSYVAMYFTGQGTPATPIATGAAAPTDQLIHAVGTVGIKIGTQAVTNVLFVGLTPQSVGVSQANFQIPAGLAAGDYAVTLTLGNQSTTGPLVSVK